MLDDAQAHHHDAVGQGHGLFLIVGDVDEGFLEFLVEPVDLGAHLAAELGVEARKRLVQQEGGGVGDEGARQRRALRLAARALAGQLVEKMSDPHEVGHFAHALFARFHGHLLHARTELDVLGHRLVREQGVRLEDHADAPIAGVDVVHDPAVDDDLARGGFLETRDHAQRGRLAAARGADDDDELAFLDGEVEVLHGLDVLAEYLA